MSITLLNTVNRILLRVSEQRTSSVTANEVSVLAAQTARDAYIELCQMNSSWPWLTGVYNADSWANEQATLGSRILDIRFIRDAGSGRQLQYQTEREFYSRTPEPYTGTIGGAKWYTLVGEKVSLNPYPNDADARQNIKFHAAIIPALPTADTDEFTIAARDEPLLILLGAIRIAGDFLLDSNRINVLSRELQMTLGYHKSRMITDMTDRRQGAIY